MLLADEHAGGGDGLAVIAEDRSHKPDRQPDGDGLLDGSDPDIVAEAIVDLPLGVFANSADPLGQRNAMLRRLEDIKRAIAAGKTAKAVLLLENLRRTVDGCPDPDAVGEACDASDWIVDCDAQRQIRTLIDLLISNLGG